MSRKTLIREPVQQFLIRLARRVARVAQAGTRRGTQEQWPRMEEQVRPPVARRLEVVVEGPVERPVRPEVMAELVALGLEIPVAEVVVVLPHGTVQVQEVQEAILKEVLAGMGEAGPCRIRRLVAEEREVLPAREVETPEEMDRHGKIQRVADIMVQAEEEVVDSREVVAEAAVIGEGEAAEVAQRQDLQRQQAAVKEA